MSEISSSPLSADQPPSSSSQSQHECCRICHGESEPDRPLFHPCKCSGSIKFIHQDCLKEWLKISGSGAISSEQKCELCGEIFQFKSIYSTGDPPQLSTVEFIQGLWPIMVRVGHQLLEHAFNGFCWLGLLPFLTSWWLEICSYVVFKKDIEIFAFLYKSFQSPGSFMVAWWNGVLATSIVTVTSLLMYHAFQNIQQEINIRMAINNVNRGRNRDFRAGVPGDEVLEEAIGAVMENIPDTDDRESEGDTHAAQRIDESNTLQGEEEFVNDSEERSSEESADDAGIVYNVRGSLVFEGSDEAHIDDTDVANSASFEDTEQDFNVQNQVQEGDEDLERPLNVERPAVVIPGEERGPPVIGDEMNFAAANRGGEANDLGDVNGRRDEDDFIENNALNMELSVRRFFYHLLFNYICIVMLEVFPVLVGRAVRCVCVLCGGGLVCVCVCVAVCVVCTFVRVLFLTCVVCA